MLIRENSLEIRPVTQDDLEAVLDVYEQCQDFLALGPVATASMQMVLKDIELSRGEGGVFCAVHTAGEKMIGVVDFVPNNYQGNPNHAYLSLLMIAAPFRSQGIGKTILEAVENEIRKDAQVTTLLLGVQVNNPQALRFWQRNGCRIIGGPKLLPDQTIVYDLQKDMNRQN
jgi:ribosomal protein S18 acetylase RimI-like enzyme